METSLKPERGRVPNRTMNSGGTCFEGWEPLGWAWEELNLSTHGCQGLLLVPLPKKAFVWEHELQDTGSFA